MYPKLLINLKNLKQNLDALSKITKDDGGCSMMIVTKGVCADPGVIDLLVETPEVDYLADSRIKNIASYADKAREAGKKTLLLRLPMHSEVDQVVKYADVSFNSELSTLKLLDEAAKKQGKKHNVVLMIDLGDLREGIFFKNEDQIWEAVETVLNLENLNLHGIGVNLTCYGAIIPKNDNLSQLVDIAHKIEEKYNIKLDMVSGGNSSSIYLIWKDDMPKGINNLRLGECFLLGNDTAYGEDVPGATHDTMRLQAQIIELKEKPSLPIGEVGKDAFGKVPHYEDRGIMKRAIIGIGKQDIELDSMEPFDTDIEIMGGSSDHIILDLTNSKKEYKVGDIIEFKLGYGGMLKTATSPYVEKDYIK